MFVALFGMSGGWCKSAERHTTPASDGEDTQQVQYRRRKKARHEVEVVVVHVRSEHEWCRRFHCRLMDELSVIASSLRDTVDGRT